MSKIGTSKSETRKLETKQESRTNHYDLEDRTFLFAKEVREFTRQIPKTVANIEDTKQVVRASGSIGANYIEANESLSKKDFLLESKYAARKRRKAAIGYG